jgi:DNA replication protein DnaC
MCHTARQIAAALPARYRQAHLRDFPAPIVERVTAWCATPRDGLLISGPAGTGKTHLAAAITRACLEIGLPTRFRRAADLYQALRAAYQQGVAEETVVAADATVRLLVLDDLGAGALTDFERRVTLEVLDRRLNALLPTVVTTNWTLEAIRDRMDERIASRLASFTLLGCTGRDRRARPAEPGAAAEGREAPGAHPARRTAARLREAPAERGDVSGASPGGGRS